jgi:peptide chain release factor subunit 1
MGKLEEHTYILDEVPGWHKQGGWSQARFQRHIEQQIYEHLKKVADITLNFFKKEQLDRLILGGPYEVITHFKNILHIYLVRRSVGTIAIDVDASTREIEKKALSHIKKIEDKENDDLMQRILDNLGKMAVAGIEDVAGILNQGRIQLLLVDPDLKMKGWVCPKCHFISTTPKVCEICGRDAEESQDIVENIIEQNFELAGEIHFLSNNKKLKKLGGIAAVQRW